MYGFKPRHAQGKPVQNLADGGIVHSLTGMLGMRKRTPEEMLAADAKVQERNREAAARVAARAKPAQQAAPAEEKAVSSYAGMSAMQRREKELGLKDGGTVGGFKPGGLIRGPGTGTSDSIKTEKRPGTFIMPADSTQAIGPEALERLGAPEEMDDDAEKGKESVPVRLSNGEFELPPEQVQALGEAVLTVMRNATHQPASGQEAPTNKGFTPHQFFADGGRVRPRGFVVGPGTETSDSIPARLSAGEYVLPADTVKAVGVDQLDALREATHKPVKGEGAKAARGFFAGGTPGGLDEAYKSWQDKKTPWYMPTPAGNMEERTAEAAYTQALRNAYSGNSSPSATGQPGGPAPKSVPTPDAAPAPAGAATANAGVGRGSINPASVNPAQPAAAATEQTNAATDTAAAPTQPPTNEVMPGVYRHGRGQYSDNASGMGLTSVPGSGGQGSPVGKTVEQAQREGLVGERVGYNPAYDQRLNGATGISAQNMAAADALVARQTPAGFQPAGSQPAGVQAPVVRNSTNDWAARKALENMATAASSITNTRRWGGEGAENSQDVQAYQAALKNDMALQLAQPGMDKAAMDANAALQRESTQQAGANQRTAMQEQGATARDAGRNALTAEELGLRREAAGFQTRAAAQQEQLRNTLLDPNATPEQRSVAQRNLAALSGKTAADRMQTVTLPDTTNEMGQVVRGGQALVRTLEDGTVQQVPIGTQRGATAPLANHVAALKANPKQAAQFDEIYGPGAAARAIGK